MSRDYSDEAALDQETLRSMLKMMRQQRDGFRLDPGMGGLGSKHSPETRRVCAELLDWYLQEFRATPED